MAKPYSRQFRISITIFGDATIYFRVTTFAYGRLFKSVFNSFKLHGIRYLFNLLHNSFKS